MPCNAFIITKATESFVMSEPVLLSPYNPDWPKQFADEEDIITKGLGDHLLEIHHGGSTSITGLVAKPRIDIIAVVKDGESVVPLLEKVGYNYKGEWNIPFKYGFTKRNGVEVNLHVFERENSEIELNLAFRDFMRNNPNYRDDYAKIKLYLASDEKSFKKQDGEIFAPYNLGKNEFIKKVLSKTGFDKIRFLKCAHYDEWQDYHRIRKIQIFDPIGVEYDVNHPSIKGENHFHFILTKGMKVVSVAHVEFLGGQEVALRSLATDEPYKNQGFGKLMMQNIEKWLQKKQVKVIKMHAARRAEMFYRKLGYYEMHFNDQSISQNVIDLGKKL